MLAAMKNTALNTAIVIPARMGASRLPGKPLADIGGRAMVLRTADAARAAAIGPVFIAAAEQEIIDVAAADGIESVMTDPALPSGTDRVRAAIDAVDPRKHFDIVVNLQGDAPTIEPGVLKAAVAALQEDQDADLAIAAAPFEPPAQNDLNTVKIILGQSAKGVLRALYFTRAAAPSGDGPLWKHAGVYAFRRNALTRFCDLPVSRLEQRERLEQLRALENDMKIAVGIVDTTPRSVDTPADLEAAQTWLTLNQAD